jgi:hypothetical protein
MPFILDKLNPIDISAYDPTKWVDKKIYWIYDVEQKHPGWHLVKIGRPSGSTCGAALGHSSFDTTPELQALYLSGQAKKNFKSDQLDAMAHGVITEPEARDWYAKKYNVTVIELGMCVPKWDTHLGVSVDGDVIGTDGMIEIKCPKRMYKTLKDYMKSRNEGLVRDSDDPNIENFKHIFHTHYDQMQLGMAILQKKWCDYIVFCTPENSVFVQRVPFNLKYWNDVMYPGLLKFNKEELDPLLLPGFPLQPV